MRGDENVHPDVSLCRRVLNVEMKLAPYASIAHPLHITSVRIGLVLYSIEYLFHCRGFTQPIAVAHHVEIQVA